MNADIQKLSIAVMRYIRARDEHKSATADLRLLAVEVCGFDQEMVNKSAAADLVDGYVKGFLAASKDK